MYFSYDLGFNIGSGSSQDCFTRELDLNSLLHIPSASRSVPGPVVKIKLPLLVKFEVSLGSGSGWLPDGDLSHTGACHRFPGVHSCLRQLFEARLLFCVGVLGFWVFLCWLCRCGCAGVGLSVLTPHVYNETANINELPA